MGIGDSWGTREELLHPRGKNGRFIRKLAMSPGIVDMVRGILDGFTPRTFPSDGAAGQWAQNRAKPSRFNGGAGIARFSADFDSVQEDLRDGVIDDPSTKKYIDMMDASSVELPDDVIISRVVGPDAFGMSPEQANAPDGQGGVFDLIGSTLADRGYSPATLGTPLAAGNGNITMVYAVPKGTKAVIPGNGPGDREVILDRDQEFVVTKVKPDGRGGYFMTVVASPRTPGETPKMEGVGHRGAGKPKNREAEIRARRAADQKRMKVPEGGEVAPIGAESVHNPPSPIGPSPTGPGAPAPRTEQVVSDSVGGGAPAVPSPTPAQAPAPGAPAAPPAPEADLPVTPVGFKDAVKEAGIESPSAGPRRGAWNRAYMGAKGGRKDPDDILRDLDSDIKGFDDPDPRAQEDQVLQDDLKSMRQLRDTIAKHFGVGQQEESPAPAKKAAKKVAAPKAAKVAKAAPAKKAAAPKAATKAAAPKAEPSAAPVKKASAPEAVAPPTEAAKPKKGEPGHPSQPEGTRIAQRKQEAERAARKPRPVAPPRGDEDKVFIGDTPSFARKRAKPGVGKPRAVEPPRGDEDKIFHADGQSFVRRKKKGEAGGPVTRLKPVKDTPPPKLPTKKERELEDEDREALRRLTESMSDDNPLKKGNQKLLDQLDQDAAEEATFREWIKGSGVTERSLTPVELGHLGRLAKDQDSGKLSREEVIDELKATGRERLVKIANRMDGGAAVRQPRKPKTEPIDELDKMTVPELKKAAKEAGVKGYSKLLKQPLKDAIRDKRSGKGETKAPSTPEERETSVRSFYKELAKQPGDWVSVASLREKLEAQGLSREEVDDTLKAMAVQPGVQLIPWDNRKALSQRDRDAAVRLGGEDNHALRIEESGAPAKKAAPANEAQAALVPSPGAKKARLSPSGRVAKKAAPPAAAVVSPESGTVSASRLVPGERIRVIQGSDGGWFRTARKTGGAKVITVTKIDREQAGNQQGYVITGTDDDGNQIKLQSLFGQNTLTREGVPAKKAAKKAAPSAPEDEGARRRALVEESGVLRGRATATTRLDEAVENEASDRALRHMVDNSSLPDQDKARLTKAIDSGDRDAFRKAIDQARGKDIRTVGGRPGEKTKFDRKIHKPIGKDLQDGQDVQVVRSGSEATRSDGSVIQLDRAIVESDTPVAKKAAPAKKASPVAARRQQALDSLREQGINNPSQTVLEEQMRTLADTEARDLIRSRSGGKAAPTARQVELDNKVREAYRDLRSPGEWVGLADLREHPALSGMSRAEQDEAIKGIVSFGDLYDPTGAKSIRLIPIANKKALTERDRAAAVKLGGEDMDAVLFGDPVPRKAAPRAGDADTLLVPRKREPAAVRDAKRAEVRARSEAALDADLAAADAENRKTYGPWLEAAGVKEADLTETDSLILNLTVEGLRDKKITRPEAVRRLRASDSPRLQALADQVAIRPPRAKAAKKAAPAATPDILARLNDFDNPGTREEAAALLVGLKRPQLVEMAKQQDIPRAATLNMEALRRELVDATVGRRLDSIATRGFRGIRPDLPDTPAVKRKPVPGDIAIFDPGDGEPAVRGQVVQRGRSIRIDWETGRSERINVRNPGKDITFKAPSGEQVVAQAELRGEGGRVRGISLLAREGGDVSGKSLVDVSTPARDRGLAYVAPRPQEPLKVPGGPKTERAKSFREAWDEAGLTVPGGSASRSMGEIRRDLEDGKITPDEAVRRMESEIEFNKSDLNDTDIAIRDLHAIPPRQRTTEQQKELNDLRDQQRLLKGNIKGQEKASSFLRSHFNQEPVRTPEEIQAIKVELPEASKSWLDKATPEDMREAAKQSELGLDPPKGDTAEEMFDDLLKQIVTKELESRAAKKATKAAKKAAPAKVARPAGAPEGLDVKEIGKGLDLDLIPPKVLQGVQEDLDAGKKTPAQIGRELELSANSVGGPYTRAAMATGIGRIGPIDTRRSHMTPEEIDAKNAEVDAEVAQLRRQGQEWTKLADRLKATRRKRATAPKREPAVLTPKDEARAADIADLTGVPAAKVQEAILDRKEATAPASDHGKGIADLLGTVTSREEADALLKGKTKPELLDIAKAAGVQGIGSRATKPQIHAAIVQEKVGRRLDSDAIGRVSTPGSPGGVTPMLRVEPGAPIWEPLPGRDYNQGIHTKRGFIHGTSPDMKLITSPEREAEVEDAIREAHRSLPGNRGNVDIADLREQLGDRFPRVEVDNALVRLQRKREATLFQESNQKTLTARDDVAAVIIGNHSNHVIHIEPTAGPVAKKAAPKSKDIVQTGDVAEVRTAIQAVKDAPTAEAARALLDERSDDGLARMIRVAGIEPSLGMPGTREQRKNYLVNNLVPVDRLNDSARRARAAREAAAAKKAVPAAAPSDAKGVVDRLGTVTSREEGEALLKGKTRQELFDIAKAAGAAPTSSHSKERLRQDIINSTVGGRLDRAAIGDMVREGDIMKTTTPTAGDRAAGRVATDSGPLKRNRPELRQDEAAGGFQDRPNADEPLRLGGGQMSGTGNMHADSNMGELWNDLYRDDRAPNSTLNEIARLATSMSQGDRSFEDVLADLRRLMDGQDPEVRKRIARAIVDIDAPPFKMPKLPDSAPPELRQMVEDLGKIPTARRRGVMGTSGRNKSVIDDLVDAIGRIDRNEGDHFQNQRELEKHPLHESRDGATQIWKIFDQYGPLGDREKYKAVRAWMRDRARAAEAAPKPSGDRPPEAEILRMTIPELKELAAKLGMADADGARKDALLEFLLP